MQTERARNSRSGLDEVQLRVDKRIEQYDLSYRISWRMLFALRVVTFLLAAAVTIFSGWKGHLFPDDQTTFNAIVVAGALIAFLSSLNSMLDLDKHWIRNRLIALRLSELRDRIRFEKASDIEKAQQSASEYWEEYEEILSVRRTYWLSMYDQKQPGKSVRR